MELINKQDLKQVSKYNGVGSEIIYSSIFKLLKLDSFNELYLKINEQGFQGVDFLDAFLDELGISLKFDSDELKKIPKHGKFITVSNHPYGILDGIILIKIITQVRPEFKVLANFLLDRVLSIKDQLIPVNPFNQESSNELNINGLRQGFKFLEIGNPLGVFPAGEVSNFSISKNMIVDKNWDKTILKFIRSAQAPILPVYFNGVNSWQFQLLGILHPNIRTVKLPSELLNKKNKTIEVRLGNLIDLDTQLQFDDINRYGRYLRSMTYSLGVNCDYERFFKLKTIDLYKKPTEIICAVSDDLLVAEISKIPNEDKLFSSGNYDVYCTRAEQIPKVLKEIGRLRELSFRALKEGTSNGLDLDEFDIYYSHLFVWDRSRKKIVGAYRLAKGKEIINLYGSSGLYISSLFKLDKKLRPLLRNSIELGRSFVNPKYQGKSSSLFLLWKGILYYLIKNPQYRYLIGPASISGAMSSVSKTLLVEFLKKNYSDQSLGKLIKARNEYKIKLNKKIDTEVVLESIGADINKLDDLISQMEKGKYKFPILLKKYLNQNAKVIGFNVDPKFNNAIDGLILLDIFNVEKDIIKCLAKELDTNRLFRRFNKQEHFISTL